MQDVSAIVYTSGTGFTRRYAKLLSRAAALPAYDLEDRDSLPEDGVKILYLGWLRAGSIVGLSKVRRRWRVKSVCAVGMAPDNDLKTLAEHNGVDVPLFYAQGGYAPEKLKGANKLAMAVVTKLIAKAQAKQAKTPEEAEQVALFRTGCDFVNEANLAPVLAWLRQ